MEYWTIGAEFRPEGGKQSYLAKLARINDLDPEFKIETDVKPHLVELKNADYTITRIKRGERRRNPTAPFITSTFVRTR